MKNSTTADSSRKVYAEGLRDGLPIALGYFAVAFSLGIAAKNIGLTAFQGFLVSFLNNASAGEYAGFTIIAADGAYWEIALITLVANARYLLMSCALSQKLSPDLSIGHRILIGFDVTDELFGLAVSRKGCLHPFYYYGAMTMAIPGWSLGTALGVIAGNILPARIVSALSVALYGMFIAVIIPPARKNKIVAGLVVVSFGLSFAFSRLPYVSELSEGMRTVILTAVIAGAAAVLFPVKDENTEAQNDS
ncbi:MAG: AzlC family ABC transporter permease [Clostridiales bacterium]|nr:AzlC family ABC transporter permease [Clostridiales bacterium]